MTWAKVDDRLHDHPKVDSMLDADELRGAAALGLWVAGLSYCADHLTDGFVSTRAVRRVFPTHGDDLAAVLVEHGLWDVAEGGWQVRGYLDCNPSRVDLTERRQEISEKRREAGRKGAAARWGAATPPAPSDDSADSELPSGCHGTADSNLPAGCQWQTDSQNPSRTVPSHPERDSPGSSDPGGRARVGGRATSIDDVDRLADDVRSVLQRGIDGLTTDAPAKRPTRQAIVAALREHRPSREDAIGVAVEVRAIVQSQNRAPNVVALYAQRLAAHAGRGAVA
jgi:hypothetical protein